MMGKEMEVKIAHPEDTVSVALHIQSALLKYVAQILAHVQKIVSGPYAVEQEAMDWDALIERTVYDLEQAHSIPENGVTRFRQPLTARSMVGCDLESCSENAKVRVRFPDSRVRYYCRKHGAEAAKVPLEALP